MLLNEQCVIEEIEKEILKTRGNKRWKHSTWELVEYSKSTAKREVHSNQCLHLEIHKASNTESNHASEGPRKTNPKVIINKK